MNTYDAEDTLMLQSYDALGDARHCYFHSDGKYVAVVTGDKRISIVNLMNVQDHDFIDNPTGGITLIYVL